MGWIKKKLFGIPPQETKIARRGFEGGSQEVRERLELIGISFVEGYHAALTDDDPVRLGEQLNTFPIELRGFLYEGAAMGLVISDFVSPWRASRFHQFLAGPGNPHIYIVLIGAGWAYARLPVSVEKAALRLDPFLGWLALDGYGFHQTYFNWRPYVLDQIQPKNLSPYGHCAFDQGLGRSLWFVLGAEPDRIAQTIARFEISRQIHLWSGVGLACAYAGGVDEATLQTLAELSGGFRPAISQGVAFAVVSRCRAANPAAHTDMACRVFCNSDTTAAFQLTQSSLQNLPSDGPWPAYEIWRQRVRQAYGGGE